MGAKLKFGVRLSIQGEMGATSGGFDYVLEQARIAEDLGFDSIWIPDHVENAHRQRGKSILEHWTTITAIGALTKRVRLGGHSLNDNLRHPGLTAKIASTLDNITNGRVILAPGSGWFEAEARAYGFDWPDSERRKARLKESLAVMQSLFTNETTTFEGEYFHLKDAYCSPKPIQKPYPPFWIAGDSPETQDLIAEFGDCWFMYSKPPQWVKALVEPMRRRRKDRPIDVALSAVFLSGENEDEALGWAEMYAKEREHRFAVPPTVEDILQSNLLGDRGAIRERLERWAAGGADAIVIQPMPPIDGMRFFGEHVLPAFS